MFSPLFSIVKQRTNTFFTFFGLITKKVRDKNVMNFSRTLLFASAGDFNMEFMAERKIFLFSRDRLHILLAVLLIFPLHFTSFAQQNRHQIFQIYIRPRDLLSKNCFFFVFQVIPFKGNLISLKVFQTFQYHTRILIKNR